jgi:hypothetical protein
MVSIIDVKKCKKPEVKRQIKRTTRKKEWNTRLVDRDAKGKSWRHGGIDRTNGKQWKENAHMLERGNITEEIR